MRFVANPLRPNVSCHKLLFITCHERYRYPLPTPTDHSMKILRISHITPALFSSAAVRNDPLKRSNRRCRSAVYLVRAGRGVLLVICRPSPIGHNTVFVQRKQGTQIVEQKLRSEDTEPQSHGRKESEGTFSCAVTQSPRDTNPEKAFLH